MANANVKEFTDSNFEAEVLGASEPVLVDFWAEWCMPCRILAPTIDEVADANTGKVKVGKVDIDSNQEVAVKYGISAIPTVVIFKGRAGRQEVRGSDEEGRPRKPRSPSSPERSKLARHFGHHERTTHARSRAETRVVYEY